MYLIAGFGVTVGFHRLLTHRAFQMHKPVEYAFAIAGSMSCRARSSTGSPTTASTTPTPTSRATRTRRTSSSPTAGRARCTGLFHAHMGWLFVNHGRAQRRKYATDLVEDRGMRLISARFHWWVALGLLLPFAFGLIVTGTLKGGLTALLWGGLVRIFLQHHVTWSINSVCHFFGRRRFDIEDHSTNVLWLAIPSLGEAWHHNHHAFPRSARHGLRWWEIDLSAMLINAPREARPGLERHAHRARAPAPEAGHGEARARRLSAGPSRQRQHRHADRRTARPLAPGRHRRPVRAGRPRRCPRADRQARSRGRACATSMSASVRWAMANAALAAGTPA